MVLDYIAIFMIILMVFMITVTITLACDPGDFGHTQHISGVWSHELRHEPPGGKQHELVQHEGGDKGSLPPTKTDEFSENF